MRCFPVRKLPALAGALLCTLLLAAFFSSTPAPPRESLAIARVIDGDTLTSTDGRTVRLVNVNTPEKGTRGSEYGTEYLRLFEGREVEIEPLGSDKYGRLLARLYAPEYVNRELVASGFAVKFLVQESERTAFAAAEEEAIAAERGIWRRSPFYGCIQSSVDAPRDLVVLDSTCGPLHIAGWTVRDESRKSYTFSNRTLISLMLVSTAGADNETTVFWKSPTSIWNNDRDTLYVLDADGRVVHHAAYGYG